MGYTEVSGVEIAEVVRRWQHGASQRAIARGTGLARNTVDKYLTEAQRLGLERGGPAPTEAQLAQLGPLNTPGPHHAATPAQDRLAPFAERIERWLHGEQLQLTRIQE